VRKYFPPGWKPRLYGRQDARRYDCANPNKRSFVALDGTDGLTFI
jgi:hypothetical protein